MYNLSVLGIPYSCIHFYTFTHFGIVPFTGIFFPYYPLLLHLTAQQVFSFFFFHFHNTFLSLFAHNHTCFSSFLHFALSTFFAQHFLTTLCSLFVNTFQRFTIFHGHFTYYHCPSSTCITLHSIFFFFLFFLHSTLIYLSIFTDISLGILTLILPLIGIFTFLFIISFVISILHSYGILH